MLYLLAKSWRDTWYGRHPALTSPFVSRIPGYWGTAYLLYTEGGLCRESSAAGREFARDGLWATGCLVGSSDLGRIRILKFSASMLFYQLLF